MEANKISLKTIMASIGAMFIIEAGFRLAMMGKTVSPLPALGFIRCLESFLLVAIVMWLEKDPAAIGLCRSKILTGFVKGLIWSAGFGMVAGALLLVLFAAGINALDLLPSPRPSSWQHIFIFLLVGGVIGPIAEEIFFRGIIYGFLRQWGATIAIALSTLIFVFTHSKGDNLPFTQIVGGLVFALAYEKEQSLIAPITVHCFGNFAIFGLTVFI